MWLWMWIWTFNKFTLLANILHSSNELLLEVLAVFGNLLPLFQKVLGSLFHRYCQDMGLLGAPLLLTGWPFVAGVHQGSHLRRRKGNYSWLSTIEYGWKVIACSWCRMVLCKKNKKCSKSVTVVCFANVSNWQWINKALLWDMIRYIWCLCNTDRDNKLSLAVLLQQRPIITNTFFPFFGRCIFHNSDGSIFFAGCGMNSETTLEKPF